MGQPIKLMLVSSNPSSEDSLDIDKERRVIEQLAWRYPGAIDIIPCSSARASDLVDPLSLKPQIVHIIAHGNDNAQLEFMDEHGEIKAITNERLRTLFSDTQTRLVVLMACFSAPQAEAIRDVVEYVIGMNYKISNRAATSFVEHFYASLFRGESVKNAFELAQKKMEVDGNDQFDIPTFVHRPEVEPAEIFIFETAVEQREAIKGTIASEVSTGATSWDGVRKSKDSDWTTFRVPAGYVIDRDKSVVTIISQRGSEHTYKVEYDDYVEIIPGTTIKWPTTIRVQTHARSEAKPFGGGGGMKITVDFVYARIV